MSRKLLEQALEALEDNATQRPFGQDCPVRNIIDAIRTELAKPAPEPVAWRYKIIPPGWTYSEEEPDREFAGSVWDKWQAQPLYLGEE